MRVLSPEYDAYMCSPQWEALKRELWHIRKRRCMVCRSTKKTQAHHLVYRDPIESGTVDDLMPLCKRCHDLAHNRRELLTDCVAADSMDERRTIVISVLRKILEIKAPAPPLDARQLAEIRKSFSSRHDPEYLRIRRENRQAKRAWKEELQKTLRAQHPGKC